MSMRLELVVCAFNRSIRNREFIKTYKINPGDIFDNYKIYGFGNFNEFCLRCMTDNQPSHYGYRFKLILIGVISKFHDFTVVVLNL